MERRDVQNGIHRSWEMVYRLDLGETFSNGASLGVNEEFRDLVLADESSYLRIYLAGINLSHYNFLLIDYSYFQFSWSSPDRVRYAYYPNPFEGNAADFKRRRELVESGLITQDEYLSILHDARLDPRVPLLRYEYAPDQHKGLHHPCSHFHIGHHGDNRWALNRLLTPLAFTLLILKLYYGSVWRDLGLDEADECGNSFEAKLIEEKRNCRLIGDALFSAIEARSFFFS
jgi:hypothetical protein